MAFKDTPMTAAGHAEIRARADIRQMDERVVLSWIQEFGYKSYTAGMIAAERGTTRWAVELQQHGKRLAERAQMDGPRRIAGTSSVIR